MAQADVIRSERINLTLSESTKQRIEHAASIEGKTVNPFIVSSAPESAERSIRNHGKVSLAHADATRFFDAPADPPPLNDRLCKALEEHTLRVESR